MARTIYLPKEPPPPVCAGCEERKQCMAEGFGEACCDECDHLLDWFEIIRIDPETGRPLAGGGDVSPNEKGT